jgi:GNAT superfamily N-acetyltransferase
MAVNARPDAPGSGRVSRVRHAVGMQNSPSVTVRAAVPGDDLDALNDGDSGWMGASLVRELFGASSDGPSAMFVAELDGLAAGYAHAVGMGVMDGHRGLAAVFVQPAYRRLGAGRALWEAVVGVCSPDRVRGVRLHADADDTTSQAVAMSHGLTLGGLHIESELDLTRRTEIQSVAAQIDPGAIVIEELAADAGDEQWHEVARLHDRLSLDAPDFASGSEPMPCDVLRTFLAEPWQVMLASHESQPIGLTCVSVRDAHARRQAERAWQDSNLRPAA